MDAFSSLVSSLFRIVKPNTSKSRRRHSEDKIVQPLFEQKTETMALATNFPVECFEDILRHLSSNDLLKCTLVCPQWNDFIGSTKSCMEKIRFCYNPYFSDLKSLEKCLSESKRKYCCLKLGGDYDAEVLSILSMNGRPWTDIFARFLDFETFDSFASFLRFIEPSVQVLIMNTNNKGGRDCLISGSHQFQFP